MFFPDYDSRMELTCVPEKNGQPMQVGTPVRFFKKEHVKEVGGGKLLGKFYPLKQYLNQLQTGTLTKVEMTPGKFSKKAYVYEITTPAGEVFNGSSDNTGYRTCISSILFVREGGARGGRKRTRAHKSRKSHKKRTRKHRK
jgi:hypothetical protein